MSLMSRAYLPSFFSRRRESFKLDSSSFGLINHLKRRTNQGAKIDCIRIVPFIKLLNRESFATFWHWLNIIEFGGFKFWAGKNVQKSQREKNQMHNQAGFSEIVHTCFEKHLTGLLFALYCWSWSSPTFQFSKWFSSKTSSFVFLF